MGFNQNFSGALETLIADLKPSGVSTISANGIPQDFSSLKIIGNARSDAAGTGGCILSLRFNNDSAMNYADQSMVATGTSVGAGTDLTPTGINLLGAPSAGSFSDLPVSFSIIIPFYSESTFGKWAFCEAASNIPSAVGPSIIEAAGLWNSTTAINSITFYLSAGNFIAGSHIKIYGVT